MSLRVAGKIAPAIVVTFAKGVTLGCMLRLVWHDFAKQRGSRMKCQQTLGQGAIRRANRIEVLRVVAVATILKIVLEGQINTREGQLSPRNLIFGK